jgi:hypothetical protein
MKIRTPITLALLVAAIAAPSALPASSPDIFERAVSRHVAGMPNALERADAHYTTLSARLGGRVDNTLDPAIANAIAARGTSPSRFDERPTGTIDAAPQTQAPAKQVVTRSGFGWGDFAVGAVAMLALVLLLGGLRRAGQAIRSKRVHPSPA